MAIQTYDILGRGVDGLADYQSNPARGRPTRSARERRDRREAQFKVDVVHAKNPGFPLEAFQGEPHRN